MSFSFQIVNGDLALYGSRFAIVQGNQKLEQLMSIWLFERFNSDRFHPLYGSVLDNYIGNVISEQNIFIITEEIRRVLGNLQKEQKRLMRENPNKFTLDEILADVNSIKVKQNYDTVEFSITYTTLKGNTSTLNQEMSI